MTLDALHKKLCSDKSYLRAFEEIGQTSETVVRCIAEREKRAWSQKTLADHLSIPVHRISQFESFDGIRPSDLAKITAFISGN